MKLKLVVAIAITMSAASCGDENSMGGTDDEMVGSPLAGRWLAPTDCSNLQHEMVLDDELEGTADLITNYSTSPTCEVVSSCVRAISLESTGNETYDVVLLTSECASEISEGECTALGENELECFWSNTSYTFGRSG
ncbi:MAG: hypothetical protein AAGA54_17205 [Myxococcota bacterium]